MHSVTIANPLPINKYYAGEDNQEVVPSLPPLNISESGVIYSTKQGGNGTKNSKKKVDKKYAAVKAKLLVFKKAGHDVGSLDQREFLRGVDDGQEIDDKSDDEEDDDEGEGEGDEDVEMIDGEE